MGDSDILNPLIRGNDPESLAQCALCWQDIVYSVPTGSGAKSSCKQILNHISGAASSGCLSAILGPSGSGKTSLLNVLAGRVPPTKGARLSGRICLNDDAVDHGQLSQNIGYVEQEDALFAFSSVLETIMFSAQLRFPARMPLEQKQARCNQVIAELGLVASQHTIVGGISNGREVRGVSGGERKRVAIAIEMLYNPAILFLDEPTSGLDSFQALNVMTHLAHCAAEQQRMVICSLHQPRSAIYRQLDHLMLLSQGNVCFQGSTSECALFFHNCGHSVPEGFNPADWFLDTCSVDYRTEEDRGASQARVDHLVKEYKQYQQEQKSSTFGGALATQDLTGSSSFATQVWMLLLRSWRERTRDKVTLAIKACMSVFFSALFGLVYLRMNFDQTSLQNRTGILFFNAMNMGFGAAIGTAQVIPLQIRVVSRERVSNLYSVLPFYIATFVTQIPLELPPQMLSGAVVYYMSNLRPGLEHFLIFTAIISLENLAAIALGMALSALFKDVSMVPQLAPAFVILFVMFSGYLLNDDSVPSYMAPLKYMSFVRYAFQALCVNEFKTDPGSSASIARICTPGSPGCLYSSGNVFLREFLGFEDVQIVDCMLYLFIVLASFHLVAYTLLCLRKPKYLKLHHE